MWSMLQGRFLSSRGSIHGALGESGFSKEEIRRSWTAFAKGQWSIRRLVSAWREHVEEQGKWQGHEREGYQAVAADISSFRRPELSGWQGKLYQGLFGKAVKAVGFGIIAEIGTIGEQRLALIKTILRSRSEQGSEKALKEAMLGWLSKQKDKLVMIFDAGFKLSEIHLSGLKHYLVRQASNCTARRNSLPAYKGRGAKPKWGELIRPLARQHQGKTLEASLPDETTSFELEGRSIKVHLWHNLIRAELKPSSDNQTFRLMSFFDPLYSKPLVLALNLDISPQSAFLFYRDRWPIEQIPLAAKQMLGCHRMFVFAFDSIFRLPELAFLVGNILTYLAASLPTIPSGFWDTTPKKHQGAYAGL